MTKNTEFVVTTSAHRPITEISRELTKHGFVVKQVLSEIGSITGTGDHKMAATLRKIRGVVDVAPSGAIDIGPPDAPVS